MSFKVGDFGSSLCTFLFTLIITVSVIGWILNLGAFCRLDFKEPFKAEVIRGISVFVPPAGAVVGWMDIEDGENLPKIGEI